MSNFFDITGMISNHQSQQVAMFQIPLTIHQSLAKHSLKMKTSSSTDAVDQLKSFDMIIHGTPVAVIKLFNLSHESCFDLHRHALMAPYRTGLGSEFHLFGLTGARMTTELIEYPHVKSCLLQLCTKDNLVDIGFFHKKMMVPTGLPMRYMAGPQHNTLIAKSFPVTKVNMERQSGFPMVVPSNRLLSIKSQHVNPPTKYPPPIIHQTEELYRGPDIIPQVFPKVHKNEAMKSIPENFTVRDMHVDIARIFNLPLEKAPNMTEHLLGIPVTVQYVRMDNLFKAVAADHADRNLYHFDLVNDGTYPYTFVHISSHECISAARNAFPNLLEIQALMTQGITLIPPRDPGVRPNATSNDPRLQRRREEVESAPAAPEAHQNSLRQVRRLPPILMGLMNSSAAGGRERSTRPLIIPNRSDHIFYQDVSPNIPKGVEERTGQSEMEWNSVNQVDG